MAELIEFSGATGYFLLLMGGVVATQLSRVQAEEAILHADPLDQATIRVAAESETWLGRFQTQGAGSAGAEVTRR